MIILTIVGGGQIRGLCFVVFQNRRFVRGLGIVHYLISILCSTNDDISLRLLQLSWLFQQADSHLSS